MTPRQTAIGLDLLTAAVVISVAAALAGFTWHLAGHAGGAAVTLPPAPIRAAATDVAPVLALAPFGRPLSTEAIPPTGFAAVLKGIVLARPSAMSSAIVAVASAPARAFREGEEIAPGVSIQTIQRHRVLLSNAGRVEFLGFPQPVVPGAPGVPPIAGMSPIAASAPVASTIQPLAPPPPPAPAAIQQSLLQRLDATPTAGGYRIGANPPPGLRSGDVIQSLNGRGLEGGPGDAQALAGAAAGGNARVDVVRGGKRMTISFPTR